MVAFVAIAIACRRNGAATAVVVVLVLMVPPGIGLAIGLVVVYPPLQQRHVLFLAHRLRRRHQIRRQRPNKADGFQARYSVGCQVVVCVALPLVVDPVVQLDVVPRRRKHRRACAFVVLATVFQE